MAPLGSYLVICLHNHMPARGKPTALKPHEDKTSLVQFLFKVHVQCIVGHTLMNDYIASMMSLCSTQLFDFYTKTFSQGHCLGHYKMGL